MKNENVGKHVYDIDEVIEVFGKYQVIQYTLICIAAASITVWNLNYIFVFGEVNYRCRVPECDNGIHEEFEPSWWPSNIDRCKRPEYIEGVLPSDRCKNYSFVQSTEPCIDWIYETDESAISTLNLACQPWRVSLIGTIHCVGMFVSMAIFGLISDKFGRKPSVIICLVGGTFGHFKTLAPPSYSFFIIIEFIEALFAGGTYMGAMILMLEISNKEKRILSGVIFSLAVCFGQIIFACIAMLARDWIVIVRIIYTPAIFFIFYIFLLEESPRWLVLNGKIEKAKKLIMYIAKTNNTPVNENDIQFADEMELKRKLDIASFEKKESILKMFKSKELTKRFLICAFARFTANFVTYGLIMNSVLLPGNKYTNFILIAVMSIPGEFVVLYLMNKIGRKLSCVIGFLISGILCILSAYVPKEFTGVRITLFLLSKTVISPFFTGTITYSMELFPTNTRGTLNGMCAVTARLGGMLAPLTPILTEISLDLTLFLFGGSAIISSLLLLLTPETKGVPLPDTIDQIEESVRKKKIERKKNSGVDNSGYKDDVTNTHL